jgi:Flp pilus assembly protein TadD
VNRRPRFRLATVCSFVVCAAFAAAEDNQQQKLDREFQSAVALYDAGRFKEAAVQLENLLPHVPNNFEVQELLGLVYASQSQDAKAVEHLEAAVRLKPGSAAARTNLAASLSHAGRSELAGEQFRKAFQLEPQDYDANHNLGEFYIQSGKIADARPLLEQAQRVKPSSYDNGYDLAQADFLTGHLGEARTVVDNILQIKDTSELHNLLGHIEEKDGESVTAEKEFEIAAHMDANEDNLFDWGCELLLHLAYDQAIDVFQRAVQLYPNSPRLRIGLGIVMFSLGKYDDAVKALVVAADMNPSDPQCYLFLSKAYDHSPNQTEDVIQRFRRYSELQPGNALAQYYYAASLWKGKWAEGSTPELQVVQSLLQKSIALDAGLPEAHMQLGNLYADEYDYDKSISEYVRALELNPNLLEAHYHLGQDYAQLKQKDNAHKEFEVYRRLRAQHLAELDKAVVQEFVYSADKP